MKFEDLMLAPPAYTFDRERLKKLKYKMELPLPDMPREKIKDSILVYYVRTLKRICGKSVNKNKPDVVFNALETVKELTATVSELLPDEIELIKRIEEIILGGWKI